MENKDKKFEKNPLSLIEGGSLVTIYTANKIANYTNIKNTEAYIAKVLRDSTESIIAIEVNGIKHPLYKDVIIKTYSELSEEADDLPF